MDDAAPDLEQSNRALARGYDVVPYRPPAMPTLGIDNLLTTAAMFGCEPGGRDVLDLGCGRGAQLSLAASETSGRLVGVDLSESACEAARALLAEFGDRVEIACADLLALTPERLGRFDVIYCLGVISFVPVEVRRRLLQLIAGCLKPGGVAAVSYYTGAKHMVRSTLSRILIASTDQAAAPAMQVAQGRALLARIQADLEKRGAPQGGLMLAAIEHVVKLDDIMFFHEMLNPESTSLETTELERALRSEDVGFLGGQHAAPFRSFATSQERALGADMSSLASGDYLYALFARGGGAFGAATPRSPRLSFATGLRRRAGGGAKYRGAATYEDPALGAEAKLDLPFFQAVVDSIAAAPAPWATAVADARRRIVETIGGQPTASEDEVARGFAQLWALGAVQARPA